MQVCFDTRRPPEYEVLSASVSQSLLRKMSTRRQHFLLTRANWVIQNPGKRPVPGLRIRVECAGKTSTWDWCLASSSCLAFISQADNKPCQAHSDEGSVTDSWGDSQKRGCWWESCTKRVRPGDDCSKLFLNTGSPCFA